MDAPAADGVRRASCARAARPPARAPTHPTPPPGADKRRPRPPSPTPPSRRTKRRGTRRPGAAAEAAAAAGARDVARAAAGGGDGDWVNIEPVPPEVAMLLEVGWRGGGARGGAGRRRERSAAPARRRARPAPPLCRTPRGARSACPKRTKRPRWRSRPTGGGRGAGGIAWCAGGRVLREMKWRRRGLLTLCPNPPHQLLSAFSLSQARAAHGAHEGAWFFEVALTGLAPAGAARVGWATRAAELQAPVGYDSAGYALRSVDGAKVHRALREACGAFPEGGTGAPPPAATIVGCYIHLPPGGRPLERSLDDVVTWRGGLYYVKRPEAPAARLAGGCVAFYRDGALLGGPQPAYADPLEGRYYPAVSLFAPASQEGGASVRVNFGPDFRFPPPPPPGHPPPRPACDMAPPKPADVSGEGGGGGRPAAG